MLTRLPDTTRGDACVAGCTGVHSYTHDGARWCWPGAEPGREAMDAEITTVEPPEHLSRRLHRGDDFWVVWTGLEVVAKLTDTPALSLLARHGLPTVVPTGISLDHVQVGDTLICQGRWAA